MSPFPKQILVIGYYDHCNLGDEQYKHTIPYILNRVFYKSYVLPKITFIDCDQLSSFPVDASRTMVVLGGGDVLNAYFLDKIYEKFAQNRPLSLVAFSVGIPYNDVYLSPEPHQHNRRNQLELFDHIFLRTKQDVSSLQNVIGVDRVHYLPDTSCFVLEHISSTTQFKHASETHPFRALFHQIQEHAKRYGKTPKVIGIMLCRHIYHPDGKDVYQEIVGQLAKMVESLVQLNYTIVLIPFNTKPTAKGTSSALNKENDVLIQRDVVKQIQRDHLSAVFSIDFHVTMEQTMLLYKQFYLTIPMRFHATLFSVYAGVPMIPIYTTKKIKNFLLDIQWPYEYVLDKNVKDLPTRFDAEQWMTTFHQLTHPTAYLAGKRQLLAAYQEFKSISLERRALIRTCMFPSRETSQVLRCTSDLPWEGGVPKKDEKEEEEEYTTTIVARKAWKNVIQEYEANMCLFPMIYPDNPAILPLHTPYSSDKSSEYDNESPSRLAYSSLPPSPPPPPMFELLDVSYSSGRIPHPCQYETSGENSDNVRMLYDKLQALAQENGVSDFRNIQDKSLQEVAASVASYYLTERLDSPYLHGLVSKMFSPEYDYRSEWTWVLDQCQQEQSPLHTIAASPIMNPDISLSYPMRFNLKYIDQNDQSGAHRSGWKYVYDAIEPYHSDASAHMLLDLYVDRTFHWKRDIYREIGVIPYTRPWVGFIHHTFDTEFSDYNNHALLQCPEFIQSLAHCRGLIVLSKTLQTQFLEHFQEATAIQLTEPVPIFALVHPTEMNIATFQYSAFLNNPDKKLLHIGGWMRNIFSFYQLKAENAFSVVVPMENEEENEEEEKGDSVPSSSPPVQTFWTKYFGCFQNPPPPPNPNTMTKKNKTITKKTQTITLRKVILKGKYMDNYFPQSHHFEDEMTQFIGKNDIGAKRTEDFGGTFKFCSSNSDNNRNNNWWKHMMKYVHHVYKNNVNVMEYVDNATYDDLITKNIVFLNLVDGSAVNTLIECLVRNTPVLVNRHPVVVEVLGNDYPLYYEDDPQQGFFDLSSSPERIYQAHLYLACIDKTPYKIESFVQQLNKLFQTTP